MRGAYTSDMLNRAEAYPLSMNVEVLQHTQEGTEASSLALRAFEMQETWAGGGSFEFLTID